MWLTTAHHISFILNRFSISPPSEIGVFLPQNHLLTENYLKKQNKTKQTNKNETKQKNKQTKQNKTKTK